MYIIVKNSNSNLDVKIQELSNIELESIFGGIGDQSNDKITGSSGNNYIVTRPKSSPNPILLPYPEIPINEPGLPPKHAK